LRYIILNDEKKPNEKLSNGGHARSEVEDFRNLGVLIPEPYVVLDFDSPSDVEIAKRLVEELDLKCLMMNTSRGIHLWFKSPEPLKNSIKTRSAIGIYYDVRSYGKLSYTVVKKDNVWRDWSKTIPADEIEELPVWLKPVSYGKESFKGMGDGDGRNQSLYSYILILQSKGFTKEQIAKTITIINNYVFAEPLPESELNTILRDESFKSDEELSVAADASFFDEDGKFKHNIFATALVSDMSIITVNETPYIYKEGYYQKAERFIDKKMVQLYPTIRRAQRAEVIDYIKILTHIKPEDIAKQEYIINLRNTRLDLRNGNALPFDPAIIDFCRVPVIYDPDAYCADLDKMLNKVFKHDRQVIDLFEEMVGYMLIKNCRFRKGFLFYGSGSNGKSTILNLLKKFIGEDNCSTIEMEKLSDRFKTAELENKLVNIGDDINRRDIVDTGSFKKLFTGESVTVERKGQDPFTLKNYAKMIFSCNEIPRIADKTYGMYSRLMLIPFTAKFTALDEDFDPFIEDKVTTDESLSYLLNIGLRGLRRLLHNNDFTQPKVVSEALEKYKSENSTTLTWIEEEGITSHRLIGDTTDKLYSDFCDWCNRSNVKNPPSMRAFHKDIEEKYGYEKTRVRNAHTDDKYVWRFRFKLE
jgi:putative DNA primase/helicase